MTSDTKMKSEKQAKNEQNDCIDWNAENEVHLFYALKGHKPVGVNRHFHMICIQELFNNLVNKEIPSKVIWDHLDKLYDMEALHENEDLPFPNDESDFSLPTEYDDLIARKSNSRNEDLSNCSKTSESSTSSSVLSVDQDSDKEREKKEESKIETKNEVNLEKQKEASKSEEKEGPKTPSAKKRTSSERNAKTAATTGSKAIPQMPNSSNSKKRRL